MEAGPSRTSLRGLAWYNYGKDSPNAQYNDARGQVAIDWHNSGGLLAAAASAGIDISRYFPIGASFYGEGEELSISYIYYVDIQGLGDYSFDTARKHLDNHPEAVIKSDYLGLKFTQHVKRLSIVVASKGFADLLPDPSN